MSLVESDCELSDSHRLKRVEALYKKANVFEQAHRLIEKHEHRALEAAATIESSDMQRLLLYLVDTVLERKEAAQPPVVPLQAISTLPIAAS